MCFTLSHARTAGPWNWDGDEIINPPIIEGARKVPGTELLYPIDIRSFLLTQGNAVIAGTLRRVIDGLPVEKREFFRSSRLGSFDFRVQVMLDFISREIKYMPSGDRSFDYWLFPDETLRQGGGDCEDRAFLLAALLLAAGVSGYAVRVVLGKLYVLPPGEQSGKSRDHVWVMYRNEAGRWMCLEPLLLTREALRAGKPAKRRKKQPVFPEHEYIPYFAFNDAHLWHIKSNIRAGNYTFHDFVCSRMFWTHFDPSFAAGVHNQIIDEALPDVSWSDRQFVKAVSLAMDAWAPAYDPREHFDNGYIREGWNLASSRLGTRTLAGFAQAAHAISDFYAHSSYACFAPRSGGKLPLFDGSLPESWNAVYDSGAFDLLDTSRFSINEYYHSRSDRRPAVRECRRRRIISGRYAQPGDQAQSFLERTFVYIPYVLRKAPDFPRRGLLPHHDEIAIDSAPDGDVIPGRHGVYTDAAEYREQFELRLDAATRHVRKLFQDWMA